MKGITTAELACVWSFVVFVFQSPITSEQGCRIEPHTKESKNKQHNPNRNANHRFPSQAPKRDNLRVQETERCTDEKKKSDCPSSELRQRDLDAESNKPRRIEWLQLFANVLMLMITALAVVVYYQQLSTTQTDERAWLRVDLVNQTKEPHSAVVVDPSQPLSAYISVTNTGKTAAKSIYVDACVEDIGQYQPRTDYLDE